MGLTKSEIFTDEQNRLASLFKVFGHPARVAILQYIINQKACICNDLVDELGLAQATISQHLKELKSIGIIQGTIEGKSVCYCIDEKLWKQIQEEFNAFFNQEVKVISCCS
ncbi:ArsR/SmtB family transcription factor [Sphingobacterium arenae]|uniref:Winged helix-turn-helix transcriptional regulator n=1 Tax=Sphingobacterium arenae TaxID=1280598 RepID=A0ABR7Y9F1_9SPHI|nr:metalloregulator ArsR/SmtB family transcription factor [Sphingobacterium arenae]MBD1427931.1 winged helix-turn-helix transcriptional regulator [Sphingobacterium arenae]